MAGRILPNLKLVNKWPVGSSGWGPDMDNNLNLIDALLFLTVLSATIVAPPSAPAQGDRYIVGVGGTGAWATNDNKVAVYIDAAWVFITPANGWSARVLDVSHTIRYTGSAWTTDGGAVTSVSGHAGDVTLAQLIADGLEATSRKGAASGYAPLDAGSKVPIANLPSSVVGALEYQGTWNASTNVPALASGTGIKGFYYKVSTAGTTAIDGNSQWNPGDMIAYDGATWDKIDGIASEVVSVAGLTGPVSVAQLIAAGLAPSSASTSPAAFTIVGKPAASQVLNIVIGVPSTLPANFAGTVAFFNAVPTAAATFTVKKITVAGVVTTLGTAQLAAGSARALTPSTQAAVTFAAGDVLQLVGPATQDATLADGGITFVLTKT